METFPQLGVPYRINRRSSHQTRCCICGAVLFRKFIKKGAACPGRCAKKRRQYMDRVWRHRNRDRKRAADKRYRQENKQYIYEWQREWRKRRKAAGLQTANPMTIKRNRLARYFDRKNELSAKRASAYFERFRCEHCGNGITMRKGAVPRWCDPCRPLVGARPLGYRKSRKSRTS